MRDARPFCRRCKSFSCVFSFSTTTTKNAQFAQQKGDSASAVRQTSSLEDELFNRCRDTECGKLFELIITKHGAKFPAVALELKEKLPRLVVGAKITTVADLLATPHAKLMAEPLLFSQQLVSLVTAFAKKYQIK